VGTIGVVIVIVEVIIVVIGIVIRVIRVIRVVRITAREAVTIPIATAVPLVGSTSDKGETEAK
jgi:hypothetical protein